MFTPLLVGGGTGDEGVGARHQVILDQPASSCPLLQRRCSGGIDLAVLRQPVALLERAQGLLRARTADPVDLAAEVAQVVETRLRTGHLVVRIETAQLEPPHEEARRAVARALQTQLALGRRHRDRLLEQAVAVGAAAGVGLSLDDEHVRAVGDRTVGVLEDQPQAHLVALDDEAMPLVGRTVALGRVALGHEDDIARQQLIRIRPLAAQIGVGAVVVDRPVVCKPEPGRNAADALALGDGVVRHVGLGRLREPIVRQRRARDNVGGKPPSTARRGCRRPHTGTVCRDCRWRQRVLI